MENTKKNQEKKQKKGKKAVNIIVDVVLVLAIALAFISSYSAFVAKKGSGVPDILGFRFFSVQSESMEPTIHKGALVIGTEVRDFSTLEKDDIITFWTIIDGERVLNTHRIAMVSDGGDNYIYTTRGDNNTVDDALSVNESSVVAVYLTSIPGLGTAFDFLQTKEGFLVIIVIPVAAFFIWQLIQFFRALFAYQAEKIRLQYQGAGANPVANTGNDTGTEKAVEAPPTPEPEEKKDVGWESGGNPENQE